MYVCAAPLRRFGLESRMVLRELGECMNVFIVSIPNAEQDRNRNMRIRNGLNNFFVCALSNGNRTEWSPIRSVIITITKFLNLIGYQLP